MIISIETDMLFQGKSYVVNVAIPLKGDYTLIHIASIVLGVVILI